MCNKTTNIDTNNGASLNDNHGLMYFAAPASRESELRKILDIMLSGEILDTDEKDLSTYDTTSYEIDGDNGKIKFNNLKEEWLEIIYDYPSFEYIINDALGDNEDGISKKGKFLMQLKAYYRQAKKDLLIPFDCQKKIEENSSKILDKIKSYHINFLESKSERQEHYDDNHINMLIAFGFIECKILEKPTKG